MTWIKAVIKKEIIDNLIFWRFLAEFPAKSLRDFPCSKNRLSVTSLQQEKFCLSQPRSIGFTA